MLINGTWKAVNIKVIGKIPQTLKFTQVVSGCVLQTISFNIAKNIKKYAHLKFNLFQPVSFNWKAVCKKNLRKFLWKKSLLIINIPANTNQGNQGREVAVNNNGGSSNDIPTISFNNIGDYDLLSQSSYGVGA